MTILQLFYKTFRKNKPVPYYAKYSIFKIIWIPIRKYLNVVLIPNTPFNKLRILLYRMIGFKIGKNVFIGMKCYMDDLEPNKTTIGNNVIISYGVYFSLHGKNQTRTNITIENNAYIGMRSTLMAKSKGLNIGKGAVVGAASLVIKDVPAGEIHAGHPAKKITVKSE